MEHRFIIFNDLPTFDSFMLERCQWQGFDLFQKYILLDDYIYICVVLGNEIIAASAIKQYKTFTYISMFLVHPKYQRQGYGRSLFNYIKTHYSDGVLRLHSLRSAQKFWRKMGFFMENDFMIGFF